VGCEARLKDQIRITKMWTRDVTQVVACLPSKGKALSH
jgi:hypothetical protein